MVSALPAESADPGYFPKVHTGRKILRARGELEKICANAPVFASRKRQCWHRLEARIGQIAELPVARVDR